MCSRSVVQLHEATQIFVVMDYVKEMTVKKSYKCGEYGLLNSCYFQLFLAFFFCWFFVVFVFILLKLLLTSNRLLIFRPGHPSTCLSLSLSLSSSLALSLSLSFSLSLFLPHHFLFLKVTQKIWVVIDTLASSNSYQIMGCATQARNQLRCWFMWTDILNLRVTLYSLCWPSLVEIRERIISSLHGYFYLQA